MSIKSFFKREKTTRYESDDYKISYSRRSMIIIAVVSLILAIAVWALAVYVDSSSYNYTSVPIEVRNSASLTDAGYRVVLGTENVSFRVTGRTRTINLLTEDSVKPYIDLSEVKADKSRIVVELKFDSEYKLSYSNISAQNISVLILDSLDETQ